MCAVRTGRREPTRVSRVEALSRDERMRQRGCGPRPAQMKAKVAMGWCCVQMTRKWNDEEVLIGGRARAGERGLWSVGVREEAAARSRCAVVRVARRPGATVRRVLVCAAYRENAGS